MEKFLIEKDVENNMELFYLKKGLILDFVKLKKNRKNEEMKEIFKNSLKRRERIIKKLNLIVDEDSYCYKDYVYKNKFIKDILEKSDDKMFERITSTLIELEIKLLEYDETFLKNDKLEKKETEELFSF